MWGFFDAGGPSHVFLVWLWRVVQSCGNGRVYKKDELRKKQHCYSTGNLRETKWLLLKIAALSFSASTLTITVFLSLYATATLHWRSGHSQSPWVLILSALPILRQTPEQKPNKDMNSNIQMSALKYTFNVKMQSIRIKQYHHNTKKTSLKGNNWSIALKN